MKNIKNYANLDAYTADTNRPTDQNTVSLIKSINVIIRKGVNVVVDTRFSAVGDTIVYDNVDMKMRVVKLGTLVLPLDSRYIIAGTVGDRNEKYIFAVANQYLPSAPWGAPWKVKLSGFSFAAAGNFTLTINSTSTDSIAYTTDDTLTTLAQKMQDAIRAIMTVATWTVTAYANYIVVEQNSYTPNVTSFTCSDAGITANILTGNYQTSTSGLLKNNTNVYRIDGSVSSWAGCIYEQFYSRYSANGNDTTNGGLLDPGVIRESRFNATDNPVLYNYYGTYRKYIAAKMLRYPYSRGVVVDNDGKANTKALSAVMFADHDGASKPAHPAAYACANYGIAGAIGLEAGDWWLPSFQRLYLIMRNVTEGLPGFPLDPLNAGIAAAGGTKIHVNHYPWSSSEYGGSTAFNCHGPNGNMSANSKYYAANVRPVSAFPIL